MFTRTWAKDSLERILATFAESALGFWIVAGPGDLFSISVAEGAAASGVIAGMAVLKTALAGKLGHASSASLDPKLATVELDAPLPGDGPGV